MIAAVVGVAADNPFLFLLDAGSESILTQSITTGLPEYNVLPLKTKTMRVLLLNFRGSGEKL